MPEATYNDVLYLTRQLDAQEQLHLLETLAVIIRKKIAPKPPQSILALQGLGKEIWLGTDVHCYIHEERAAWNG